MLGNDVIYAKLRDKYIGVRIREYEEEDVNHDYEPEYFGILTAVVYKAKKEGGYGKGYYLEATEERDEERDPLDRYDSDTGEPTPKRIFKIDQDTHDDNIVQEDNVQYKFKVVDAGI
jgi:hypothetical protein